MAKYHYVVEPVDVDGDGVPDGDLVKQYEGKKLISTKFVPVSKLKKIAKNVSKVAKEEEKIAKSQKTSVPKERIVYKSQPSNSNVKPVVVKDGTNFGQYLKAGVGMGAGFAVGHMAVDAVADGIGGLFE
jgi:hypothetical protein